MSKEWVADIFTLQSHFGFIERVKNMSDEEISKFFLEFGPSQLQEEVNEIKSAKTPEEYIDGLIDLTVFALQYMVLGGFNVGHSWDEVYRANKEKEVGEKPTRPNPFGLPDLIKPDHWKAPLHIIQEDMPILRAFAEKENYLSKIPPEEAQKNKERGDNKPHKNFMNEIKNVMKSTPPWKYKEGKILEEIRTYLSSTYLQHYTGDDNPSGVQTIDLIKTSGNLWGFCVGNILKYASRLGKKDEAKKELMKIIHYSIFLLNDLEGEKE